MPLCFKGCKLDECISCNQTRARSAAMAKAISLMSVTCEAVSCPREATRAARASSSLDVSTTTVESTVRGSSRTVCGFILSGRVGVRGGGGGISEDGVKRGAAGREYVLCGGLHRGGAKDGGAGGWEAEKGSSVSRSSPATLTYHLFVPTEKICVVFHS